MRTLFKGEIQFSEPQFEVLNKKFENLRELIATHNYPSLRKIHEFTMNSQNDPVRTYWDYISNYRYFPEIHCRRIQESDERSGAKSQGCFYIFCWIILLFEVIEQVLDETLEEYDREYDRLLMRLQNQRRRSSPKPKGDVAFLKRI